MPTSQRLHEARHRRTVAAGNSGGPGRPRGFREDLLRAADDVVGVPIIRGIMLRASRMALEGNMSAIKFLADRYLGRAADAPTAALALHIDLPTMRTAADCNLAIDRLAKGISDGTVDRDSAKLILDLIQVRLKAIEVNDLEQRLAELEKAAEAVDLRGRNGRARRRMNRRERIERLAARLAPPDFRQAALVWYAEATMPVDDEQRRQLIAHGDAVAAGLVDGDRHARLVASSRTSPRVPLAALRLEDGGEVTAKSSR